MSAGELAALVQGLLGSSRCTSRMVPPDNRCCFCLTLRTGSIFIGLANCVFYLFLFLWYLTSGNLGDDLSSSLTFTNMDVSVFIIVLVQLLVNLLLVVGAVRRIPSHAFPWISANAVFCGICLIGIAVTVFWGTTKLGLTYTEYISLLTMLGLLTGINLFCVIVVFQWRHNTLVEERIERERIGVEPDCASAPPPPPSYEEIARLDCKLPLEDGPPEYEDAVAMLAKEEKTAGAGAVLRKKSLTNNSV